MNQNDNKTHFQFDRRRLTSAGSPIEAASPPVVALGDTPSAEPEQSWEGRVAGQPSTIGTVAVEIDQRVGRDGVHRHIADGFAVKDVYFARGVVEDFPGKLRQINTNMSGYLVKTPKTQRNE